MATKLTWMFELMDRMSGPAGKMEKALGKLQDKIGGQGSAVEKMGRHAEKAGDSVGWFATKVGLISGVAQSATNGLLRMGESALGMAVSGGKFALEAASFRENSLIALESVLGTRKEASAALNQWESFAQGTPWETRDMVNWGKTFRIMGLSSLDTMTMLKGVSDIGALNGFNPEKVNQATQAFAHMFALGKVDMEQMRQFATLNIPLNKVFDRLAVRLHTTAAGARARQQSGMLGSTDAIAAILDVVAGKGDLGNLTNKGASSFSGLLSTLESRPFELFENLESSKGFKTIKKVMKNLADVLNPASKEGKNIIAVVTGLADKLGLVLGPLTGPEGKKSIVAFFNAFVDGAKEAMGVVGTLATGAMVALRFMKNTAEMTGQAAGAFATLFDGDANAFAKHDAMKFLMEGVLGSEGYVGANLNSLTPATQRRIASQQAGNVTVHVSVDARGGDGHDVGKKVASAVKEAAKQASDDLFRRFLVEQGM